MRWFSSARVGFVLVAGLYLLSFPYHPGLRSPNELCRLWQARALVDHGTLAINGTIAELGMVGDLSCVAVVEQGGVRRNFPCVGPNVATAGTVVARWYYPSKAPLVSFLGAPVYAAARAFGPVSELLQTLLSRLFVTVLPALGLLWLLRRVLRSLASEAVADTLVVVYALGTMAFSYAQTFMSHQLTACLLFATFFVAWRVERGEWGERAYLLAGLLASAVVACEYTGALGVVCVAVYVAASRWGNWTQLARAVGLVLAGASPLLVGLMAYHQAAFGGPLASGYTFLNDPGYQHWHQGGFLGIRLPDAQAFFLSLFSPLRGLFTLSPFLLGAVWGVRELKAGQRPLFAMLIALLLGNAYFTSSFAYDSWGWTVGPRHLTPLMPFLMLPLAALLTRLEAGSRLAASVLQGLCVAGVLAMGLTGFVNYVPDDVSTSVFGLAVPLLGQGVWPVSWLAAFVPNPASGAVLVALVLLSVAWVAARSVRAGAVPVVLALVVLTHLGVLKLLTKDDDHDVAARRFLTSIWVAPVGVRLEF